MLFFFLLYKDDYHNMKITSLFESNYLSIYFKPNSNSIIEIFLIWLPKSVNHRYEKQNKLP